MSILNTTTPSFNLDIETRLTNPSSYHPTIYAFNGTLYFDGTDKPFLTLPSPQIKANHESNQTVKMHYNIDYPDGFNQFSIDLIQNKTLRMQLRGSTKLKLGGLPKTTIHYDKTVITPGKPILLLE